MNYNQVQSDKQRADKELMRALAEIDRLKFIVGEQQNQRMKINASNQTLDDLNRQLEVAGA